ncbi:MAG: AsmA family protein [Acidobacteriaceae bacterium]
MKNPGTPAGNISRPRIFFLAAFALLVLAIVVPPFVNINRFRHSIVQSISAGLDRPVYANSVELTLFPRPAFVLHHLTVAEWPEYGAEPVITAETVTASLRASTLWHRRVEIASLHFDAPSVNLARAANGEWNFESLISNSPALRMSGRSGSGASSSTSPPPFPYVEATDARINFKRGAEKLPFSLEGAQLAFWMESGNEWHIRIKARPVRTDLPPGDAGQILGEASVKTTGVLMDSPVRASLEWRRGQLGEISRLLHGEDSGWRGTVDWTANVQGTLAKARLTSDVQVEEFRRAEFIPPSEIDLAAHCTGQYVHADRRMDQLDCDAPLGGGHLRVKSMIRDANSSAPAGDSVLPDRSQPTTAGFLTVALQQVSAGFFLDLLRQLHPGVAADTTASGEVNGNAKCEWRGLDTLRACSGEVRTSPLTLHLSHVEHAVHLSPLVISNVDAASGSGKEAGSRGSATIVPRGKPIADKERVPGTWDLAAVHASLGGASSASLAGTLTSSGLTLQIDGPVDLRDLSQLGRAMNSPVLSGGIHSIRGTAQMALTLRSNWLPQSNPTVLVEAVPNNATNLSAQPVPWFVSSQWEGMVQIHNATVQLSSFPGAIQIAGGQVNLTDTAVEWIGLTGIYAHIPFDGSIRWETSCPTSRPPCARTFTLHTANLNVDRLQGVLRRTIAGSGLLEQLNPWAAGAPQLPEITGNFKADMLSAGKLSLKNASMQLHLQGHRADLVAISGNVFGGTLSGLRDDASESISNGKAGSEAGLPKTSGPLAAMQSGAGSAQWGDGAPIYTLRVALGNIQPNLVAAIWHEKWGRGTAIVEIRLKTHGWSTGDLAQNASGNFAIDWRGGTLAAWLPLTASATATEDSAGAGNAMPGVTRFQRLHAVGHFSNQKLLLDFGQLVLASQAGRRQAVSPEIQSLSGTVTFSRVLDLKMQPSGVSITGPLDTLVMKARTSKVAGSAGAANAKNP